jgi:hypothetical protein
MAKTTRIKELLNEYNIPVISQNQTDKVLNHISKMEKNDEFETVCFGLETDDGDIVKVFVQVEQADAFEKALSEKISTDDSIEDVLNDLQADFNIVDVVWPEETEDEANSDIDDGTDSLNPNINYDDFKGDGPDEDEHIVKSKDEMQDKKNPDQKEESLSFGQRFAKKYLGEGLSEDVEKTDNLSLLKKVHKILGLAEYTVNHNKGYSSMCRKKIAEIEDRDSIIFVLLKEVSTKFDEASVMEDDHKEEEVKTFEGGKLDIDLMTHTEKLCYHNLLLLGLTDDFLTGNSSKPYTLNQIRDSARLVKENKPLHNAVIRLYRECLDLV